jgi:transmembrane sensor
MTENNRIDTEAALWVVRHRGGPLTSDDQRELDAWLSADPRHRGAFVRLNAVRADLRRLAALSAGRREEAVLSGKASSSARFSRRQALAAGVAALAAGSSAWLTWRSQGETYVSGVGELRQVSLTDGSNMVLNTATETRVRYNESEREVVLSRGEAHFEVAKDRTRPFVVRSGTLTVTAIGTAFSVRLDGGLVDVTVTEGTVELGQTGTTFAAAAEGARRRVSANQRAIVAAARPVEVRTIEHEEAERRLAWRAGMVAFKGEPLAEAVAEINRHNRRRIVIEDPTLAARPVVGMFRANDIDTFARTAAAAMGAEIIEQEDVIRLETGKTE